MDQQQLPQPQRAQGMYFQTTQLEDKNTVDWQVVADSEFKRTTFSMLHKNYLGFKTGFTSRRISQRVSPGETRSPVADRCYTRSSVRT